MTTLLYGRRLQLLRVAPYLVYVLLCISRVFLHHGSVEPALGNQLIVPAQFSKPTMVQHQDAISVLNGAQAVGNHTVQRQGR